MNKQTYFKLLTDIVEELNTINHRSFSFDEQVEALNYLDNLYWSDNEKEIKEFLYNHEGEEENNNNIKLYFEELERHLKGDFTQNANIIY